MEDKIIVQVAGHPCKTLTFYPITSTGSIKFGVGFENGNEGGWVISYADFLKMARLAKEYRARKRHVGKAEA